MKKLLAVVMMCGAICTSLAAAAKPETHVWRISYAEQGYYYFNDADDGVDFRVFVNESMNGNHADKVTMLCNGKQQYLTPGVWTDCHADFHKVLSLVIPKKDFQNGADGVIERG